MKNYDFHISVERITVSLETELAAAIRTDVIDASVAVTAAGMARHEDVAIATSDPDDIHRLLSVLDVAARVVQV